MNTLILIKKEAIEAFRTYRFFIIGIILLLFAFASPVTAKLLPDIIKSFGTGQGITIEVATPTVYDSWLQFFSNNSQMTLVIFIITFGHSLGKELTNGTLIFLVTKGISRNAAMMAKIIYQAGLWLCGLLLSFVVTYVYNLLLFPGEVQDLSVLLLYLLQLWLFGLFFISLSNLGQVLLPKAMGGMLACFLALVIFFIMNIFTEAAKINPLNLIGVSVEGLKKGLEFSQIQGAMLLTIVLTILAVIVAQISFKRISIY